MAKKQTKVFRGIDLSRWNQVQDFGAVKAAGLDFVILKAGGSDMGFYQDSKFSRYYDEATAAGLEVGAYYFAGPLFYGRLSGVLDAQRFIKILAGRKFGYPVFIDIEATQPSMKQAATEAAIGFCETMEAAGYFVGIYASDLSGFQSRLDHAKLSKWCHWVADYTGETDVCKDYQLRQYSSRGTIPGIQNYVDLDISIHDFPKIMKQHAFNNMKKED